MDEKAREKCLKEVRLLQSLDHPNIIRYLDSFIDDKDLIIIVEWAAAGDLKRQLRKVSLLNTIYAHSVSLTFVTMNVTGAGKGGKFRRTHHLEVFLSDQCRNAAHA